METKDNSLLLFKDKQNNVTDNGQYNNFTLNKNHQISSDAFSGRSKSVITEKKKVLDYDFAKDSETKKESYSWNKSAKDLSPFFVKTGSEKEVKKENALNASTLSLYIEAYENSNEANLFDVKKEEKNDLIKKGFHAKQINFDSTLVIQNAFEFPRQQENGKAVNPEISQYNASQKLLNPNLQTHQAHVQQSLLQHSAGPSSNMEEAPPTRTRRSTKKRDTYSPSRFDTPLQRQPRKSANTVKKSTESPAPSPVSAALLPPSSTSVHSVERKVLPSASTSISSVSRNKNSSAKLSLPSSSFKRPRTSLLKLPKLPPKEEIFISRVKSEPVDVELPKDDVVVTPPPPQQRNIPFDFSNPTAQNLPDRRNKSKSVYQMGLLPRTVPIVRPSRNKRNETPTSDKEANILSTDSVEIKEEQAAATSEESSLLPSTSVNPIFALSSSKTVAKRGRKSNPNALLPASYKAPKSLSPVPMESSTSPVSAESTKPLSPMPAEPLKLSLPMESTPIINNTAVEGKIPSEVELNAPLTDNVQPPRPPSDVSPPSTSDVPVPPQEAIFIPPPLPPPRPVPFDYSNPAANELPERRNKSKSVFEIAPLLYKKETTRRPRKQSIKKVSVSENDNSMMSENAKNDTSLGSAAESLNAEGGKTDALIPTDGNAEAATKNDTVTGVDKKKKRRKRPLRLTMKKKKVSRTSLPVEVIEDGVEVEEGNEDSERADYDDEASEDEIVNECELENYGESSTKFLADLHPDLQASFKHYEVDDGSYFTRFVLYGNTIKEDAESSEEMTVDKAEYPSYLGVFLNGASKIIEECDNCLKQTGAVDVFSAERMNIQVAIKILETKFNKENLCDVFIYGLSEISKIILQTLNQKLPLPQMYIKCRDIATVIAHSFISYPTKLLFIFHQLFLTHLNVDALIVYMVLCRFVNQVFKIANVLKEFSAPHLDEINAIFIDTVKQNLVDPFREMVYKIDREFLSKDIVVVALVCNDASSDQYLSFQKLMLWFNTGFRKLGGTVESLTLSADWNNPELLQISAYNAIAMVQSYFKFITDTYATSKLIVVNYGDPSMFFYHAIHYVERISGVINIGFSTSSVIDEIEHVRGSVEDTILNMAYCPSLFVTGEKAENSDISHYDQILKHYKTEQAGLIIVGDADDALTVSSKTLLHYGITPACIKRILLEHFADFIEKCIVQPIPPRTYFPAENYVNDPDFELYNVVKEEVTTMHMKLFEQTKKYYDLRADLSQKLNKRKSDVKISPNGLTKEEIEEEIQSTKTEETMEKFSQALVKLQFS